MSAEMQWSGIGYNNSYIIQCDVDYKQRFFSFISIFNIIVLGGGGC